MNAEDYGGCIPHDFDPIASIRSMDLESLIEMRDKYIPMDKENVDKLSGGLVAYTTKSVEDIKKEKMKSILMIEDMVLETIAIKTVIHDNHT